MGSISNDMRRTVSVMFGPIYPELEPSITYIRSHLSQNPSDNFLYNALKDLPSIWEAVSSTWPALRKIPGEAQLSTLARFLCGESPLDVVEHTNLLLVPVTVILHLIEFCNLKQNMEECEVGDIQGFCVGFLAAIAAWWADDDIEFQNVICTVLRLSVCIGALVDLDEISRGRSKSMAVRWKTIEDYKYLVETLACYSDAYIPCITDSNAATVTVAEDQAIPAAKDLVERGLSVKFIPLRGRFHHPDHLPAVKQILELCERDSRFRFPKRVADLASSSPQLRSNIDAEIIHDQLLHSIALECILTKQAKWFETVIAAFGTMELTDAKQDIVSIGPGQFVPRLVRRRLIENNASFDRHKYAGNQENTTKASTNGVSTGHLRSEGITNGIEMVAAAAPPIAITGFACRYPNADSVEALWKMLDLGQSAVIPMPNDRLKPHELIREPKGPFWGNYISQPEAFDHRFFGISAREAESMDPQQRLLLQVAYEAMESSGYCGLRVAELPKDVGCYVGVGSDDYSENVGSRDANAFSATGTLQAFNSGRISHYFGWSGPSVTIDTACSSAAVAIHLACKALQNRDCSIAVAGGVNLMTDPRWSQNLAAASFLSPTGASKAFDADADGYCRGEGAGLVVLRSLDAAMRDGDPIHAIITGSAVNQGANCSPITVPDSDSQSTLYLKALAMSAVKPEDVTYVEAHGTGTQVGDPIEFNSIRRVFGGPHRSEKLYVGSIKDNIGHTETSSGVAGLVKTILMMQKRRMPKQANFTRLNPKIPSPDRDQIVIPKESTHWGSNKRIAMVTNYGAAGSNAAIIVRQHNPSSSHSSEHHPAPLSSEVPIFISAQTKESLRSFCNALHASLSLETKTVNDVAYNLAIKQNRNMEYFVSFLIDSANRPGFLDRLSNIASGTVDIERRCVTYRSIILCFGGQTGVTANISKNLFDTCELLRFHLGECERVCQELGLPSLFPKIFESDPNDHIISLHCILFSIQYASAKSWLDSGLKVERIIGHSFGQLTALCVAGGLTLLDCMRLISQRAKLMDKNWGPERGAMVSVEATEAEVQLLLNAAPDAVDVACFNGPRNFVLAGEEACIQRIEQICLEKGMKTQTKRLRNTHAFHSRLVDSVLPELAEVANTLSYKPLKIPVEACSEDDDDWSLVTADKVVGHSRNPVHFQRAVERITQRVKGPCLWLEAGSASPIISMVRRVVKASQYPEDHIYQPIDLAGPQAQANLTKATCALWSNAVTVQFWQFHRLQSDYNWMNLPPYQFAKTSHWIEYNPHAFQLSPGPPEPSIDSSAGLVRLLKRDLTECLFAINNKDPVYRMCTEGHAVVDQNLCPASLYIEMVVQAAMAVSSVEVESTMPHIEDLVISAPLVLEVQDAILLHFTSGNVKHEQWKFSLITQGEDGNRVTTHATGNVSFHPLASNSVASTRFQSISRLLNSSRIDLIATSPSSSGLKQSAVYRAFRRAVNYADYYRGVQDVYALGSEAAGHVVIPSSPTKDSPCDPILIDNFIQVAGIHVNCLTEIPDDEVFVCSSVGEILIGEAFTQRQANSPTSWAVYSNFHQMSEKHIKCDIFVMAQETRALALCVMAATFTGVSIRSLTRTLSRLNNNSVEPVSQARENGTVPRIEAANVKTTSVTVSVNDNLHDVQVMLGDLLGVSVAELLPSSSLVEIGIDSLMSTEVLTEIKKQFHVDISTSQLAEIPDVSALVRRIFPGHAVLHVESHPQPSVSIDITLSDPKPRQVDDSAATNGDIRWFADIASKVFLASRTKTDYSQDTNFQGFCSSVYPQQMNLVTSYVIEAFRTLGISLSSLEAGQAVPQIKVLPQHEKVRKQLYAVLEESNLVYRKDSRFFRTNTPVPTRASSVLSDEIIQQYPHHASEHKLLHTTGSRLADCLSGTVEPLSLLFQDAKARQLIQDVYANAPMFKTGTLHLAQYLEDLLPNWGCDREFEIMEIGAGTGGTTDYLLRRLAAVPGIRIKYTFTDMSSSLVTLARKRFKAYPFIQFMTLNIEQSPPSELRGKYDIIISTNCIHATRNLTSTCANIHKLLHPSGVLCLIELTRNLFWFDLVFGLLEGWWLFDDGRSHALANERLWNQCLRDAGFGWVDWTENECKESEILRLIVASPTKLAHSEERIHSSPVREETLSYAVKNGQRLFADVYYPEKMDDGESRRPIALMIHGGGHIMLSRKDIRPNQTQMLLDSGFLPVSIDYRLCPEVSLLEGPMQDVRDALAWARRDFPRLMLKRGDIRPDGDKVVAIGWSTGGHLAMTLAWTAPEHGIQAPAAILSFYSPTDYTDRFWSEPNFPYKSTVSPSDMTTRRPLDAINDNPITNYNPPPSKQPLGGWMSPTDPRSLIALHMNWTGQTLPVLLYGWQYKKLAAASASGDVILPSPTLDKVQKICPLSQISCGRYRTPTFLIHGTLDDLIPLEQVQRTYDELVAHGVEAELRVVEDEPHLFDLRPQASQSQHAIQAVFDGHKFLRHHVEI